MSVYNKVNFFFVGYPKSGSSTYYDLLRAHPEVFSPDVKELSYFNTDHHREIQRRLGENYYHIIQSVTEYDEFFKDGAGKICGEFSPAYVFSEEAPLNIFNYNPSAKILISIREPVSFLRSFHFQMLYGMVEDEPDFLKALALEDSRRNNKNIPEYCDNPLYLFYSSLIEYTSHIKRYCDLFGPANVKIIIFDDIVENEGLIYQAILHFLGVRDVNFTPPSPDRNPSHALRFAWLRRILYHPPIRKWLYDHFPKKLLPLGIAISWKVFKKNEKKPYVSKEDIALLKKRFKPNVEELDTFLRENHLIDKKLVSLWRYE